MAGIPDLPNDGRGPIELRVEYKRLNRFFFDYAKNISKGETFIKTDKPQPVGTSFVFKLFVPNLAAPLVLSGEVRWVQREGELRSGPEAHGEEPGMGIRFVYKDEEERRDIQRTVERMMIESLGQLIYSHLTANARGGA